MWYIPPLWSADGLGGGGGGGDGAERAAQSVSMIVINSEESSMVRTYHTISALMSILDIA